MIRYVDRDGSLDIVLMPVVCGTEPAIVLGGFPEVIPLEMCCLGRQESLPQPAHQVEPDRPG